MAFSETSWNGQTDISDIDQLYAQHFAKRFARRQSRLAQSKRIILQQSLLQFWIGTQYPE